MNLRRLLAPLALFALFVGCFDIEQTVMLEDDLSGTARIYMTVDTEPMVHMMAAMKRGFEGLEGPPTAEELAATRAEFEAQQQAEQAAEFDQQVANMRAALPDGVELVDAKMLEGDKMGADFRFAFDHVTKLKEIRMDDDGEGSGSATDSPFAELVVEEKDGTLLIATPPANPAGELGDMMMGDDTGGDPTAQMVRESIESMRVHFELTAPFEVLEDNATEKNGDTLIWSYGFDDLMSMVEDEEQVEAIRVLFKL